MKTTLKPGDLVVYDPGVEGYTTSVMVVSPTGRELLFQFGTVPFSRLPLPYEDGSTGYGLSVHEAVLAIDIGVYPFAFPGYVFKSFDAETGESYADPRLDIQ